MTIYGLIFRLFGWVIGLGLVTGELTYYDDGHTDAWMVLVGIGILILWGWPIVRWLLNKVQERNAIQAILQSNDGMRLASFIELCQLGMPERLAALTSLALMPIDDACEPSAQFAARIRAISWEFTADSQGASPEETEELAVASLQRYLDLAVQHRESYYIDRYSSILEGGPSTNAEEEAADSAHASDTMTALDRHRASEVTPDATSRFRERPVEPTARERSAAGDSIGVKLAIDFYEDNSAAIRLKSLFVGRTGGEAEFVELAGDIAVFTMFTCHELSRLQPDSPMRQAIANVLCSTGPTFLDGLVTKVSRVGGIALVEYPGTPGTSRIGCDFRFPDSCRVRKQGPMHEHAPLQSVFLLQQVMAIRASAETVLTEGLARASQLIGQVEQEGELNADNYHEVAGEIVALAIDEMTAAFRVQP
jgi:hypothetical protein